MSFIGVLWPQKDSRKILPIGEATEYRQPVYHSAPIILPTLLHDGNFEKSQKLWRASHPCIALVFRRTDVQALETGFEAADGLKLEPRVEGQGQTMKISRTSFATFLIAAIWTFAGVAHANDVDYLPDGDFDELEVGTGPDRNSPAGAWEFAVVPGHPESTEDDPNQLSVVPTSAFVPGATGNSLQINYPRSLAVSKQLSHVFEEAIEERPGEIVRANFDVFVPASEDRRRGGIKVIIGGDVSGSVHQNTTDRGPQITLKSRGQLQTSVCGSEDCSQARSVQVLDETPVDVWQHFQVDIDLANDTYDLFWSAGDDPLVSVKNGNAFRSGTQDFLDHFSVAFHTDSPSRPVGLSYLDNISIEVLQQTPGDANLDGVVDFPDFLALSEHFGEGSRRDPRGWSQGDFDGNGEVDFPDFLILSENFGAVAAASATSVPEPTTGSIALFGLLGLIGFRKRR